MSTRSMIDILGLGGLVAEASVDAGIANLAKSLDIDLSELPKELRERVLELNTEVESIVALTTGEFIAKGWPTGKASLENSVAYVCHESLDRLVTHKRNRKPVNQLFAQLRKWYGGWEPSAEEEDALLDFFGASHFGKYKLFFDNNRERVMSHNGAAAKLVGSTEAPAFGVAVESYHSRDDGYMGNMYLYIKSFPYKEKVLVPRLLKQFPGIGDTTAMEIADLVPADRMVKWNPKIFYDPKEFHDSLIEVLKKGREKLPETVMVYGQGMVPIKHYAIGGKTIDVISMAVSFITVVEVCGEAWLLLMEEE